MAELDRYEVIIRDRKTGDRWSMMFDAEDFAHAYEQATEVSANGDPNYLDADDEIIQIVKDYA